jgi:tetratricopeptide (TPR) repeat protein
VFKPFQSETKITMKAIILSVSFLLLFSGFVKAQQSGASQNVHVQLGNKSLYDGDFKAAVKHFEKALPAEEKNPDVLYLLAYSYYHSADYSKAISTFGKVVSLKPKHIMAYYYRAKARNILGGQMNSPLTPLERETLLVAAIKDFTKTIELDSSKSVSLYYQNRAIAYRDYGTLKGQKNILQLYDKTNAINAYRSAINDLQYVLNANPGRKDIMDEMKKVQVYKANLEKG